ncbi:ABC transporter permease [Dictyobacter arantiisoli]|uniref:Peptide ABC transporter permease n=1 Tax=Dictyobacter arantiisoli TaxID=2014874 RepID=A0A5A5TAK3_9CHLR|nr:ABC transporter permease [Dictyobacter arantiisoli]GCF08452.1 peptide ABC transporter permease [Dictyobacter arantiisoli]
MATALQPVTPEQQNPVAGITIVHNILKWLTSNWKMTTGTCILVFFILMAIFGPLLAHMSPTAFSNDLFQPPSAAHWLGTTSKGEDIFAQLVYGARISLLVGFIAAIGSTILQILFGLLSGYFGGLVDNILSFVINVFLILPGLPLGIAIASFAPNNIKGPILITILLTFTSWSYGARVLRAQTLSMRSRDFVESARSSGEWPLRIIFFEILPNIISVVASSFVGTFVYTIGADVAFEFLGLGNVSQSTWGTMLFWAQSQQAMLAGGWWWFIPPGVCVSLLCAGLAFLNNGIDEVANPRLRVESKRKLARRKKEVVA